MHLPYDNEDAPPLTLQLPDICPHCHVANLPTLIFQRWDKNQHCAYSLWKCNYGKCNKIFIAKHFENGSHLPIKYYVDATPVNPTWPVAISELKSGVPKNSVEPSRFFKVYSQSLKAENEGLDEIAGIGYRKALEFLIKDLAILSHPEETEPILHLWLGPVIQRYFSGEIRDLMERATWLGNDETHYTRIFEEFDITHLKELIGLIVAEFDRDFKKAEYLEGLKKK